MTLFDLLSRVLPGAAGLVAVLAAAWAAGALARRLGQPPVVAEIAAGILVGLVLSTSGGSARLLPPLKLIGEAGLVLFLVAMAHEISAGRARDRGAQPGREVAAVAAGAFVIPLLAGLSLAGWVLLDGGAELRGKAPALSVMLLIAVALGVTAVPVLSRILADRNMAATPDGRLALTAAVVIDALSWPLLALAIAVKASAAAGVTAPLAVLAIGAAGAAGAHALLRRPWVGRLFFRAPQAVPALIGLAALAAAASTEHFGVTVIFGAVVVGLAIPHDSPAVPWDDAVRSVGRAGRLVVPAYFVVTGITVLHAMPWPGPWILTLVIVGLGIAAKVGGGYLGARLGGRPPRSALRVGVLVNTRGLTEIVVLQAGYSAAIITADLFFALIVMALVTTALTVPLLWVIDRRADVGGPQVQPGLPVGFSS
jgi:Kef-type K+ transport system membrane component KefB